MVPGVLVDQLGVVVVVMSLYHSPSIPLFSMITSVPSLTGSIFSIYDDAAVVGKHKLRFLVFQFF